jgi:hypothetical protein
MKHHIRLYAAGALNGTWRRHVSGAAGEKPGGDRAQLSGKLCGSVVSPVGVAGHLSGAQ